MRWARATAMAVALLATACAHPGRRAEAPPEERPAREVGLASYYARALEGQRTASGVPYDGRAMTCAHPSHAFGTLLRVVDLETGRSVLVKVTDRGPFARGRVVDLSYAAARALGILDRGVVRVAVEVVRAAD